MRKCKNCSLPAVTKNYCEKHRWYYNAKHAEWRAKNRDKVRASWKKHYEAHKDRVGYARSKAYREANPGCRDGEGKRYYARHKESSLAGSKRRYYANLEHYKAVKNAWRARNWESVKVDHLRYWHKRRALQLAADVGDFTIAAWNDLCDRQGDKCIDCKQEKKLTIGHAIPLSRGGKHTMSNIIAQCRSCNSKQGSTIHPSVRN